MSIKLPKALVEELDQMAERLLTAESEERDKIMSRLMAYERSGKVPLPALLEMADQSNPSLSMYAISALGRNGQPEAVAKLTELVDKHKHGNPLFLETIVDALGETKDTTAAPILLNLLGIRAGWKGKLLGRFARRNAEEEADETRVRQHITLASIRALEKIQDPRASALLGGFLDHADPLVRWHTIQNIVKANLSEFNDRLTRMAQNDDNDIVREMAQIALEKLTPLPPNLNN